MKKNSIIPGISQEYRPGLLFDAADWRSVFLLVNVFSGGIFLKIIFWLFQICKFLFFGDLV